MNTAKMIQGAKNITKYSMAANGFFGLVLKLYLSIRVNFSPLNSDALNRSISPNNSSAFGNIFFSKLKSPAAPSYQITSGLFRRS
jgi:hypothetical protein